MQRLILPTAISILLVFVQAGCTSSRSTSAPVEKASNVTPNQSNSQTPREVLPGVTKIVAETLKLKPEEVDVDVPLARQKNGADDLDVVEIVMSIEETYKIEIKDEELGSTLEDMKKELTVRKLADIVLKKRSERK